MLVPIPLPLPQPASVARGVPLPSSRLACWATLQWHCRTNTEWVSLLLHCASLSLQMLVPPNGYMPTPC